MAVKLWWCEKVKTWFGNNIISTDAPGTPDEINHGVPACPGLSLQMGCTIITDIRNSEPCTATLTISPPPKEESDGNS